MSAIRTPSWKFADHLCRHCRGRVMVRRVGRYKIIAKCARCEAEAVGGHDALCCCGIEVKSHGNLFECIPNPEPSPSFPSKIVVRERPWTPPRPATAPGRRAQAFGDFDDDASAAHF